ncbi:glycosyltransferase [Limnoglobus roseus]|uniref:GT2 and GT4 families glycosyltransferase n=1 Tax=Limnoglobus roseus TaxID=2598579 RepID=A0A5C1ALH7_9BACT|nr:glycosyltransferase [Limnoglobus roseus]QEL18826.1 GT2 and GT4 families glycosyltransferase [Limnoglobus roseus]
MEAVQSSDFTFYVERIVEPYTSLPLLGVGGYAPAPGWTIEVRYDDEPAAVLTPRLQDGRHHFSTQLPLEPAERVRVVAVGPREIPLLDVLLADIGHRAGESAPASQAGGIAARAVRSVATGEILSPSRWVARFSRAWELRRKVAQKLRYKLLARRFRPRSPYDGFLERTQTTPADVQRQREEAQRFRNRPKISVLMPVYNVRAEWFREAVESVVAQAYDNWELCIADDASTKPELIAEFAKLTDPRIKLTRRPRNGHICESTNTAADSATGDFVALLDHDDRLAPDALLEVVRVLQDHPEMDLLYSDEDKIDAGGRRYDPQFKPDWSPELLLSYNYVNHFTVVRRRLFERVGRYRVGYEGSQDHDLLLRVTERTDRVQHVPQILYHWRAHEESTAGQATQKPIVHTAGRRAVEDALERRNVRAALSVPYFAAKLGLPVLALEGANTGPTVAVIVYGTQAAATARAVKANTAYQNYTLYLVLDEANTADALNRMAASRTEDHLLFLQGGTEPRDQQWLSRLVVHFQLSGVGATGGLARDRNGTVISAGTVLGLHDGTAPDDACRGLPADQISYYFYAEATRNTAAVGQGCLLTSRALFEQLGGFDADRFGQTLFDVDYCTRLRGQGRRCVHVAGAELVQPSRAGRTDDPAELLRFKQAYGRPVDPYSNPHFSEAHAFRTSGDTAVSLPRANRSRLKAVVAAHNLNSPEGAPRYLSEIVLGLRGRQSIEPSVWSPKGGAGEAVYSTVGVPVAVADAAWSTRFVDGQWTRREYDAAQRTLRQYLRTQRPDVIVANTLLTFPMVEAAARLGLPCVWIIHESYSPDVMARLFPPFARWRAESAFILATRVVPASHDTAKLFEHLNARGNVRVVHNGIPTFPVRTRARLPGAKKRIISVGTACERKGQHTLVEAAAILAQTRRDFVIDIVGVRDAVPYAGYLRQLVARRGLAEVVNLVTETNNVADYYENADVFVCTSHMETFSRSILEAEAYRLPIVSTACQGIGEQVKWGFNALKFETGNAVDLARQLEVVLADDALRAKMAARSRSLFDNHLGYEEMLDRYDLVIRSAVGRSALQSQPAVKQPSRRAA